ncbi:hypothetical protein H0S57_08055 [Acinetobacter johnsonii]|uniref:hypothetical protein n=1 Tax=Acinetobacter johnsonii TaxID=40214 RepID=UPI00189DF382|nr:hypothetical protein [Acinetobacter johnsonii]QPF36501.1 hypothetical protein H0S57_08055 [Acinetobacter johnsonii]
MIKTPLSTVLGGAGIWTPGCTVIGGQKTLDQLIKPLFSNGEQGFFYDPNDLSTMFQDAVGTVPVTDVGQAVGLLLDKSKGSVMGSNIVTDGGFNDPTKWLPVGSGWSISKGNAVANNAPLSTKLAQVAPNIVIKPNTHYEVTYSCTDWTSGQFGILIGGAGVNIIRSGTGTFTERVLSGNLNGELWLRANTTLTAKFDNITVKEIYGNHAYQTTSAARPVLRDAPHRIDFDAVDDKLITNLQAQLTGCTVVRSVPNVGTQILTGQTIPATYEDNKDHCGLIVINRALTATETSQITKLFNKAAWV